MCPVGAVWCGQEGVKPSPPTHAPRRVGHHCIPVGLNWEVRKWVKATPHEVTVKGLEGPARKGLTPVPSRGDSVPQESWSRGGRGEPDFPVGQSVGRSGAGGVAGVTPGRGQQWGTAGRGGKV